MIERASIEAMREREVARFIAANPKSKAHAQSAQGWFQGVPFQISGLTSVQETSMISLSTVVA